jgi:hypothetical protein
LTWIIEACELPAEQEVQRRDRLDVAPGRARDLDDVQRREQRAL